MPDREKVIEELEDSRRLLAPQINAKYHRNRLELMIKGIEDALNLLKEQEAVKVKDYADIVDGIKVGYCPKCDRKIVWNPEKEEKIAFCKYCGQAVEWEQ